VKSTTTVFLCAAVVSGWSAGALAQTGVDPVYTLGPGLTAPAVVKQVKATYDKASKDAGTEGTVTLEAVVLPDGTVGDVTVVRALSRALDAAATKALKAWTFKPGMKDGQPVAVKVTIEMTYSLKTGAKPLFPAAALKRSPR
jgi:periplasmic protein TonB